MILNDEEFMLLTSYLVSPLYRTSEHVPADKDQETIQPEVTSVGETVMIASSNR